MIDLICKERSKFKLHTYQMICFILAISDLLFITEEGLIAGFLFLQFSVVCTSEPESLLYLFSILDCMD